MAEASHTLFMTENLSGVRRVQGALEQSGFSLEVIELPTSARTALEAANAVGCQLGQIVKSLVFRGSSSDTPYLVLVSGPNRADLDLLEKLLGEPVQMAEAKFVREVTGFGIGGVAPIGLSQSILTVIDRDLLEFDYIWAAAGTPRTVFRLSPDELQELTAGQVAGIS